MSEHKFVETGSLEITTKIGCPVNCSYCPQDKLKNAYGDNFRNMSYEDFVLALETVPKTVRIDFSGFCEPFANPHALSMIEFATENLYYVVIYTSGFGVNEGIARCLSELNIQQISLHDTGELGKRGRELIRQYCHNTTDVKITLHDRAGNVNPSICDLKIKKTGPITCGICGDLFNRNVLLPNGDVVACCMDYSLEHKFGNLFESSYEDICNSEAKQKFLQECKQEDSIVLCRKCTYCINHWR